jgi:preprotein translocase subunit SecG
MQIWTNLVLVVQLLAAIAMIGLVLVQHGKGADMGASFGSGASGSLFGATGSANFLSRFTAVCAGVFFVCTLSMAYLSNSVASRAPSSGGSVLDRAVLPAGAPASALGAIPGGGASTQPAPVAAPAAAASVAGGIPTK